MKIPKEQVGETSIKVKDEDIVSAQNLIYTERFYALTKLIRISTMINNAKIIRFPKIPNT